MEKWRIIWPEKSPGRWLSMRVFSDPQTWSPFDLLTKFCYSPFLASNTNNTLIYGFAERKVIDLCCKNASKEVQCTVTRGVSNEIEFRHRLPSLQDHCQGVVFQRAGCGAAVGGGESGLRVFGVFFEYLRCEFDEQNCLRALLGGIGSSNARRKLGSVENSFHDAGHEGVRIGMSLWRRDELGNEDFRF